VIILQAIDYSVIILQAINYSVIILQAIDYSVIILQAIDYSVIILQAIDAALTALKCSTTENFVRRQAWELIKCFLVSVMSLEDDKQTLTYLFTHTR
jgi:hypothetical protein